MVKIAWRELSDHKITWNADRNKSDTVLEAIEQVTSAELFRALNDRALNLHRAGHSSDVHVVEFPYGEIIAEDGALISEIINGDGKDIPLGLLLDGCIEIFAPSAFPDESLNDPSIPNTRPIRILSSGKLIGLFETVNEILGCDDIDANWSLSSGARTVYILGNYKSNLSRNIRAFPKRQATKIHEPWDLAQAISQQRKSDWRTKIVFFPKYWALAEAEGQVLSTPLQRGLMIQAWEAVQFYLGEDGATSLYGRWTRLKERKIIPAPEHAATRDLLTQLAMCLRGELPGFIPYRLARFVGPFDVVASALKDFTDTKGAQILVPGYLTTTGSREVYLSASILRRVLARRHFSDAGYTERLSENLLELKSSKELSDAIVTCITSTGVDKRIFPVVEPGHALSGVAKLPFGNRTDVPDETIQAAIASHVELRPLFIHASIAENGAANKAETFDIGREAFEQLAKEEQFFKSALKIKLRSSSAQVLSEVASQAYGSFVPRRDTAIVVHNHLLPSTTALIDHLLHLVESPRQIFILGKSYSTVPNVEQRLLDCRFVMQSDQEQRSTPPGKYTEGIKANIEAFWKAFLSEHNGDSFKRIIVCDDGGRLARWMPESLKSRCVVVEQTSSGSRICEQIGLDLPIIDVGRSAAKRRFESGVIARAVRCEVSRRRIPVTDRIGVVGYGHIGKEVVSALKPMSKSIFVFDKDAKARTDVTKSITFTKTAKELAAECDVIFGCAGEPEFGVELLGSRRSAHFDFVSCSSGDVEFLDVLQKLSLPWGDYAGDLSGKIGRAEVTVRNGGFPINFNRQFEVEPDETIMLTRALCFGAICWANELMDRRPKPGLIMLDVGLQRWICERHNVHFNAPVDKAPEDDKWWSDNSGGRLAPI
jgi:hypothetical protein